MTAVYISVGLVALFVGLWFAYVKWGAKNKAAIEKGLDMASVMAVAVSSLFKNNDLKTDPHDVLIALSKLAATGSFITKQVSSGGDLSGSKEQMKQFVIDTLNQFPELKDKVSVDMVDKEVSVALAAIAVVPKK
jgi:hypothetical protein